MTHRDLHMLKSFVFDDTGVESGEYICPFLINMLKKQAGINAQELFVPATGIAEQLRLPVLMKSGNELLVFAHESDLFDKLIDKLQELANEGAVVVRYSRSADQERIDSRNKGYLLTLSWNTVKQVLLEVSYQPDLVTFLGAVKSILKRKKKSNVLNALAILCWCMTCNVDDERIKRLQEIWAIDRSKWLGIFNGITKGDVMIACGHPEMPEIQTMKLEEVKIFLAWIWPDNDSLHNLIAPDFEKMLKELESQFGIRV